MRKKIGVLLSGCGYIDGSEIHESTLTLLALDKQNAIAVPISINKDQFHTVNHHTQNEQPHQIRNMLEESARIARSPVKSCRHITGDDIDGLIIPGGFGVAKNFSNFAQKGADTEINPDIKQLIIDLHKQKKPQGFICIAPILAAAVIGRGQLTIGTDKETRLELERLGATHIECTADNIVMDLKERFVSTPAYMLNSRLTEIQIGIEKCVKKVLEWTITKPTLQCDYERNISKTHA